MQENVFEMYLTKLQTANLPAKNPQHLATRCRYNGQTN